MSTALATRRRLAAAVGSGALASASGVALLATSGWLICRASQRPPVLALAVAIGAVQAFALGRGVARYGERLAVHDVALSHLARARVRLFERLVPLVPGGLPGRRSGGLLGAFVSDTEAVGDARARELTAAIEAGAGVVAGVLVALAVDPLAGAVVAAGAAANVGVVAATRRWHLRAAGDAAAARNELYDAVVAAVRSAPDLVALGREDLVSAELAAITARAERPARRAAFAAGVGRAGTAAVAGATLLGVLAAGLHDMGVHGVGRGGLSPVLLAAVALAALGALDTLAGLPDALAAATAGQVANARLAGLAACTPPATEPDDPAPAPPRPAALALEAAVVSRGGTTVLDGLTLGVGPGRRVGLSGESGAGKTTAVLTLLHFLEVASGRATLGGVDVARLSRETLGQQIGWVPERPHVFAATLGANLRLARPGASDAACREALSRVGLGPFLAALPEGLDTRIGARGRAMSAGEHQRLCLARVLLTDPDVLVLDEPTAHLDPDGATAILPELVGALGDRSLLVVSHDERALALTDDVVEIGPSGGRSGPGSLPTRRPTETSHPLCRGSILRYRLGEG